MKLIEKSYKIDLSKIEEGYLYNDIYTHSNNRNKARYKLLDQVKYENISLRGDIEITYKNIPVIRDYDGDIINVDGKNYTREKYREVQVELEHYNSQMDILKDANVTHCYILKRGSYYLQSRYGYTKDIIEAGVFTKEEAVKESYQNIEIKAIPIDKNIHNNHLSKIINNIKSKLI